MNPQTLLLIVKLLDLAVAGMRAIPELKARYEEYSATIQAMIAEDRGATDEEWEALLSESAAETDRITIALQKRRDEEAGV